MAQVGAGSVGDVVVQVLEHNSNPARLTEWRGIFNYTLNVGGLVQDTYYAIHLRADIRKHRSQIHLPPDEPAGLFPPMTDSRLNYAASGSASEGRVGYSWSGSGTLQPVNFLAPPADNAFLFNLTLSSSTQGTISVAAIASQAVNYTVTGGDPVITGSGALASPIGENGLGAYTLTLIDATINADKFTGTLPFGDPGLYVPAPPSPSRNTTVRWGNLTPSFPPDPKSPR